MRVLIAMLALVTLIGCGKSDKATIQGQFYGEGNHTIYLEQLSPSRSAIIDSVTSSGKGTFRFDVPLKDENPTFYNVRVGNQFLPLLLARGDRAKVNSVGNIYNSYTITGSKGSELLRELNRQTITTLQRLDSIMRLYEVSDDMERTQQLGRQYGETYIQLKRNVINFIMNNSSSLAVIVPFYQPIFGTKFIFDEPEDIIYLKLIADSLENYYPTSPYVRSLRKDVASINQAISMDSLLTTQAADEVDFPDIVMADALGKTHKLSELKGKVILLDFTATDDAGLKMAIRDMVEVYEKYAAKGFEIYQVSLDKSKSEWIAFLSQNNLPWITVSDFMGGESPAVRSYNVKKMPSNFLIDRDGNIVGRDLYGKALDDKLSTIL